MFNPFQMMGQNPMNLIQNQMFQQMQRQNPELYSKVQQMTNGKNEGQMKEMAMNIAKERGIDLSQFASQFGIKL